MSVNRQTRYAYWLLLAGLIVLGYVFAVMKADVAIPVQGKAMRGLGNVLVRADIDASVRAVHITEGQAVAPGTLILSLNDVEVSAELMALSKELRGVQSLLKAKQTLASIQDREYRAVRRLVELPQENLLSLNDADIEGEKAAIVQEIRGTIAVSVARRAALGTLEKELEAVKKLVALGLEPAGEQRKAELALSAATTEIIGLEAKIALLQAQLRGPEPAGLLRKAELALETARAEVVEAEARIAVLEAQRDRLSAKAARYRIESPYSGRLLKLLKYNIGDVVKAGDPVAEIVPQDGDIVFEAKINPQDISGVKVGNEAIIALSAFNRYEVNPIPGRVAYVSPASLVDADGSVFFIARVALAPGVVLTPEVSRILDVGQTADISIKAADRSVMAYLLSPLIRGMSRSFSER